MAAKAAAVARCPLTSSSSRPSYVDTCAQQARHFIMRLLRAGQRSARRLNCGVSVLVKTAILAFLALVAGNVCAAAPSADDALRQMAVVDRFVWDSVQPFYRTPVDEIRHFGKLEGEDTEPHPDGTKTRTFHFPGVVVAGLSVPGKGFFLQRVEVTTNALPLSGDLQIGSQVSDVLARLGTPAQQSTTALTFQGETERVTFQLHDERVSRVQFFVYTD